MGMRGFALAVLGRVEHLTNARAVDACGEGTHLGGRIQRLAPGGRIEIGAGCWSRARIIMQLPTSRLQIGDNCFMNAGCVIECFESVTIGSDLLLGPSVKIGDGRSHSVNWAERVDDLRNWRRTGQANLEHLETRPIVIKDGVWIGAEAIILPGVTIGEGATVGAASVVTKSVPPFTVVAGNPARVVKELEPRRPRGASASDHA